MVDVSVNFQFLKENTKDEFCQLCDWLVGSVGFNLKATAG